MLEETHLDGKTEKEAIKPDVLKCFWDAIETGEYVSPSNEEIERIADEAYYNGPTLAPLSAEDAKSMRKSVLKEIKYTTNREILKELAIGDIGFLPQLSERSVAALVEKGSQNIEVLLENGSRKFIQFHPSDDKGHAFMRWGNHAFGLDNSNFLIFSGMFNKSFSREEKKEMESFLIRVGGTPHLTRQQKKDVCSNLSVWENARCYESNYEGSVQRYGYRNLCGENDYGYTEGGFLELITEVKKRTGKSEICMLDVGGGIGTACWQAEQLDRNLHATNLTFNVEPAMYPVETVLCSAEAMPAFFKEKYDFIVSNYTSRYLNRPDLMLENCLRALSVGGEGNLAIETSGLMANENENYASQLYKEYRRLKELQGKGYIQLEVNGEVLEYEPTEKNYFPSAFVKIIKLKSLED